MFVQRLPNITKHTVRRRMKTSKLLEWAKKQFEYNKSENLTRNSTEPNVII